MCPGEIKYGICLGEGWGCTRWTLVKPEYYKFMGSALKNFQLNLIYVFFDHLTVNLARTRFFF